MDVQAHHARIVAKRLILAGYERTGQARDGFIRDSGSSFGTGRKILGSSLFVKYLETYCLAGFAELRPQRATQTGYHEIKVEVNHRPEVKNDDYDSAH